MRDLTQGSIPMHLVGLAAPIAIGMLFQTLYYLIDLYFVAQLGQAAIAGVSAGGNLQFLIMALTQILGVGAMALIAHATGRRDQADRQCRRLHRMPPPVAQQDGEYPQRAVHASRPACRCIRRSSVAASRCE